MILKISSLKDERIIEARELSSSSGRIKKHKILLEGEQIIHWALKAGKEIEHVFFCKTNNTDHKFLDTLIEYKIACYEVSEGIIKKISNTKYIIPFIGVCNPGQNRGENKSFGNLTIVLNNVVDHGNIGTIIRTAKAFGITNIVSTNPDFDAYFRKTIEASRGKVFDIQFKAFNSDIETITTLKNKGYQIIATSPHAPTIQSSLKLINKPIALVIGNESDGISEYIEKQADSLIQIPMSGSVESLNVGVATGISIYELKLKLVLTMLTKFIRSTLGREVNVTGKLIQRTFDVQLKKVSSFSSTQVILLMVLKCDELMTLEQVSKDTAAYGDELGLILKPLIEDGYIQYSSPEQDKIRLTAGGERMIGELWNVVESSEERVLEGFSESEKKQLMIYLQRIQSNCTRILEQVC
jgi:TrmH family RNA methyltransferase